MIDFKPIEFSDRDWINEALKKSDFNGAEYCFGNNYVWRMVYHITVADHNGFYLVRSGKMSPSYLFPIGSGDFAATMRALMADAKERGEVFHMHSVLTQGKALLETLFPDTFEFTEDRDNFDYIYSADKLATLAGKKMHSKRNHIARFEEAYPDWSYEPITVENIPECLKMNEEWCRQNGCKENLEKKEEACVVKQSLARFFEFGYRGGLLRAGGRVVAFTFGEPLNSNTFVTHVEKAFADVQGAYPMINREFAKEIAPHFEYINREEDTGAEGLRKAKLSYKPEILLEKYNVTLK